MQAWPCRGRWQGYGLAVAVACGGLVVALLRVFDPATAWFYPPCPFHALTGYLCPGCGTLRALHQLLNGHVATALRLNPLMMLLLPYAAYEGASGALETACGRRLPRVFLRPTLIWILLAVIVLFWILRNIPAFAALGTR